MQKCYNFQRQSLFIGLTSNWKFLADDVIAIWPADIVFPVSKHILQTRNTDFSAASYACSTTFFEASLLPQLLLLLLFLRSSRIS